MTHISAVIFDLGGVIVPLDYDRGYTAFRQFCPFNPDEVSARIRSTGLLEDLECGRAEPHAFARAVCQALEMDMEYEEFSELWGSIFPPETLVSEAFLESIARSRRLLLLSNTNAIHFPYIQRNFGLLRHFHECVLSYEVGAMKPAPEIYVEVVKRAGGRPEDCFFTDDVEANVEGARRVGIDAVVFESEEQVRTELRKRGVELDHGRTAKTHSTPTEGHDRADPAHG